MASAKVQVALDQVDAFNRRDLDAQVEGYADEFTMTDHARGMTASSKKQVKAWMQDWITGSSDAKVRTEEVIDAGDVVVSVLAIEGTNDGPMGPMPASNRQFQNRGVQILHFDSEGRIVQHDNFFDQLSTLVQLGFIEPPG